MIDFCELYWQLDSTTKTNQKVSALKYYLAKAEPGDAIWAIWFLTGERIKRLIPTKLLRQWAMERAGIEPWLFEECYDRVGDLAETISLLLPPGESKSDVSLKDLIEEELLPFRELDDEQKRTQTLKLWSLFDQRQLFVLGKLMTGGFRVGVSKKLVVRAIASQFEIDPAVVAHRMMGQWEPTGEFFETLVDPNQTETPISKPYPFFLANPLKNGPDLTLGQPTDWVAEWKWDGIRAQLIRRDGQTFLWSRGEDLITDQFPEVAAAAEQLPDGTVIDGELVGWSEEQNRPLEFNQLQRRLGRKKVGKKLLTEVPGALLCFDILENDGDDIRALPLTERQTQLSQLLSELEVQGLSEPATLFSGQQPSVSDIRRIRVSPAVEAEELTSWEQFAEHREAAKQHRAEGLMLKRKDSTYQVGRPVGDWWKWKVEPYTIDAVLIYAQRGHGRRASLYTDYTFAVWQDAELVPFAKAYSGLTDAEIRKVDAFVRKNTNQKFGPVRSVTPQLVFELAFENIQTSTRHKSGVAVRFPRINRWRHDKQPADADRLETILEMVADE
ncbi:ATP-dependent DNA ligase [Mariniblastus fucicola]|uniref:DNA ligase (ATP) n=1 Tax=Mariniblastus fucicola TaxID=980251 RepID=A0A5B9P9Q6_9BACT|nr:ATP-dependent DNA ligase [Mariniblastus fucicola]QEG23034.1 putative ATP-dependent DNA ligase YkoU [Mariniblastus fucicola]